MIEKSEVPILRHWKLDEVNDSDAVLVDFDGTMTTGGYPSIGDPDEATLMFIKRIREDVRRPVVIWTCRTSLFLCKTMVRRRQAIRDMEKWLHDNTVKVDGILTHEKPICSLYIGDETLNPADLSELDGCKGDDHGLVVPEM